MELFEVAFLREPTKAQADDGDTAELVGTGIYAIIAKDRDTAIIQATVEVATEGNDVTGCRVIVRPFKP